MNITEVSEMFGITPDTLRYYEKIGLLQKVYRNANGRRNYQEEDIKQIEFVKCMRSSGLGIDVLKRYLDLLRDGDDTIIERKEILEDQRSLLEERKREIEYALDKLDYKINNYEKIITKK